MFENEQGRQAGKQEGCVGWSLLVGFHEYRVPGQVVISKVRDSTARKYSKRQMEQMNILLLYYMKTFRFVVLFLDVSYIYNQKRVELAAG